MVEERKVFHESWYRIAGQRLALRSSVKVRRQLYRGSRWHVLHDPFNNQFYRLTPSAYAFVARLGLERTLEELTGGRAVTTPVTNPIGCNVKWEGRDAHWMPPEACDLV